jgi:hypothetical protein
VTLLELGEPPPRARVDKSGLDARLDQPREQIIEHRPIGGVRRGGPELIPHAHGVGAGDALRRLGELDYVVHGEGSSLPDPGRIIVRKV